MSITAKFARKYTAKGGKWIGKTIHVYLVSSKSDEELQHYEESCGIYLQHDDDTGKPLWKTDDLSLPSVVTLKWNYDGTRVYVEDKMSEQLEIAGAVAMKQARAFGVSASMLHQAVAAQIASSNFTNTTTPPVQKPASVPQQQQNPNPQPELEPQVAEGETPFTDESDE
jgi:hypothetical protein